MALIFIRLALCLALLTILCIRHMLWYRLIEEAERDLPLNQRYTSSTFGPASPLMWLILKRHTQLYPASGLRKKLRYWAVAGVLTVIALASTAFLEK